MPGPVEVQSKDIDLSDPTKVVITNHTLTNGLIHDQADTVGLLSSTGASVDLSQVSVDPAGRVVIANPALHSALTQHLGNPSAQADNGVCGVKCGGKQMASMEAPVE